MAASPPLPSPLRVLLLPLLPAHRLRRLWLRTGGDQPPRLRRPPPLPPGNRVRGGGRGQRRRALLLLRPGRGRARRRRPRPFRLLAHRRLPLLRLERPRLRDRCHIFFLLIRRLGLGFPSLENPKATILETSRPHYSCISLSKWFNDHPEYLANPFYIGGDSYAGKIVPFIAQIISEGIEAGMKSVPNLKGYLVGNPSTGESIDFSSKVPYAHGFGIISDQLYEAIMEHCQGDNYANPANALCAQSMNTFNSLTLEVMSGQVLLDKCVFASPVPNVNSSRIDGSDGRKILREEIGMGRLNHLPARPPFTCFNYRYYLSYFWANDRRARDALGIKKGTVDEWVRCHDMGELPYARDLKSAIKYHRNVTSRGYRALVYRWPADPGATLHAPALTGSLPSQRSEVFTALSTNSV